MQCNARSSNEGEIESHVHQRRQGSPSISLQEQRQECSMELPGGINHRAHLVLRKKF